MGKFLVQAAEVEIVSDTIRVDVAPVVTATEAQPVSKAVAGASQTIIVRPA